MPFDETVVAGEIGSYKPALAHWREFASRTGADPARHVHVAASLFHDIGPANELGLPSIWINRLGERAGPQPTRELPDLTALPDTLDALVGRRMPPGTKIVETMTDTETRIDVPVEHRQLPPDEEQHPNTCPSCQSHYRDDELAAALYVCPHCGHHFPMPARARIEWLADAGSFVEEAAEVRSADPLGFFDLRPYVERLAEAELNTGLGEAMVVGRATLDGHPLELAVMDFAFMGGSMGSAVGEKFARACESAVEHETPLVAVSSSGGARMQEGILSLMTLPKTVVRASRSCTTRGLPMFAVIAHPTTGGVLASFASLGDVTIAEPGALIAFAGPARRPGDDEARSFPTTSASPSTTLRFGHLDAVVPRPEQRPYLARLLRLFGR